MDHDATHHDPARHDPNNLSDEAQRLTQLDSNAQTRTREESERGIGAGDPLGNTGIVGSIVDIVGEFLPFDF